MLLKGAVEIVEQPGPGFYSRLFVVEKVTGGWRLVISLSSQNDFFIITKFRMETLSSVLVSVWMFTIDLQDTYFQILVYWESRPYLRFCLEGRVYQFKPVHGFPGLHQSIRSGFGGGASERRAPSSLPGQLAGGYGVEEFPSSPSGPFSVVLRPRDCGQLEEVGLRPFDSSPVPRHGSRHNPRMGDSLSRSYVTIQGDGHVVSPPARMWQRLLGHMASLELFFPRGRTRM